MARETDGDANAGPAGSAIPGREASARLSLLHRVETGDRAFAWSQKMPYKICSPSSTAIWAFTRILCFEFIGERQMRFAS